jgi:hypothetical protein
MSETAEPPAFPFADCDLAQKLWLFSTGIKIDCLQNVAQKTQINMAFLRDLRTMGLAWGCFGVLGFGDLRISPTSLQDVLPAIVG